MMHVLLPWLHKPTGQQIQQFLAEQALQALSYPQAGITQANAPTGYVVDHNRVRLGYGQATFDQACQALQRWRMFDLGWVQICPASPPLQAGTPVAIVANVCGLWFLNACRVVYTVDQTSSEGWQRGFAYGTLPGHVERGEERFLIEWQSSDDAVWYDILAYSQPNALLARLGYPIVRHLQKRFARESKQVMANIGRT